MKTVKVVKSPNGKPLLENPFVVESCSHISISEGGSLRYPTSIFIDLPDDVDIRVRENLIDDIGVENCFVHGGQIFVSLINMNTQHPMFIKEGVPIVRLSVVKCEDETVRFTNFVDGKRLAVGDSVEANIQKGSTEEDQNGKE